MRHSNLLCIAKDGMMSKPEHEGGKDVLYEARGRRKVLCRARGGSDVLCEAEGESDVLCEAKGEVTYTAKQGKERCLQWSKEVE